MRGQAKNLIAVLLLAHALAHSLWHLPPAAPPATPQFEDQSSDTAARLEGRGFCLSCLAQRRLEPNPPRAEPAVFVPCWGELAAATVSCLASRDRAEPDSRGPPLA